MASTRPDRVNHRVLTCEDLLGTLTQVGHALNLVCELPEWLEHGQLPKHPRHAVAESFAMNCRALGEFFWGSHDRRDVRACNYVPGTPPGVAAPQWIAEAASVHVAHFSRGRLGDPLVSMTYEARCEVRDSLLEAATEFADRLIDECQRDRMRRFVSHAGRLAAWPPPPTAGQDPGPWIAATAELGSAPESGAAAGSPSAAGCGSD